MRSANHIAATFGRTLAVQKVEPEQAKAIIHEMAFSFYKTVRYRRHWRMVAQDQYDIHSKHTLTTTRMDL